MKVRIESNLVQKDNWNSTTQIRFHQYKGRLEFVKIFISVIITKISVFFDYYYDNYKKNINAIS